MRLLWIGALSAACCLGWGAVAFDTFELGDAYDATSTSTVFGPDVAGGPYLLAYKFDAEVSGMLDRITIALEHQAGPADVIIGLYADDSGGLGTLLGEFNHVITQPVCTIVNPNDDPILNPDLVLQDMRTYWLALSPTGDGAIGWYGALSLPTLGTAEFNGDDDPEFSWDYYDSSGGAFRVTVKDPNSVPTVPEPATIAFAGLALAAAARRRRKG